MPTYVFIDSRVVNIDSIRAALAPDTIAVILDPLQDGLTQIAQALTGVTNLDAIHVISHGSAGTLYLGNSVLTGDNLAQYGSTLASIGASLSNDGDLLLYGCDVALGPTGQAFIQQLADLTGADVAASNDTTGSAAFNGDWVLEATIGAIETQTLAPENFEGVLANEAPRLGDLDLELDTTFNPVGTVITPVSGRIYEVSINPVTGKVFVAGGSDTTDVLVQYNSSGTLDTTFNGDGIATQDNSINNQPLITSVILQNDGYTLVARGTTEPPGGGGNNSANFELARFTSTGTLDGTFGSSGRVSTDVDGRRDKINDLALQPDGRIIAVGYANIGAGNQDLAIVRYLPNGALDASFGASGEVIRNFRDNTDAIVAVAIQSDGKILVEAGSFSGMGALLRYTPSGNLDNTFGGGDGIADLPFPVTSEPINDHGDGIALQSNGKIVVRHNNSLSRFNADGSLDTSFGVSGFSTTVSGFTATHMEVVAGDKIMLVGNAPGGTGGINGQDFAIVRYNSNGTLDTTFDGDGVFTSSVGAGIDTDIAYNFALGSDGSIVVAGESNGQFALLRMHPVSGFLNRVATEDSTFTSVVDAATFVDPEGGLVTYTATRGDGSALPA